MIERTGKPIVIPEGSNDAVIDATLLLRDETQEAERRVMERLLSDAAKRLAEKSKPADA